MRFLYLIARKWTFSATDIFFDSPSFCANKLLFRQNTWYSPTKCRIFGPNCIQFLVKYIKYRFRSAVIKNCPTLHEKWIFSGEFRFITVKISGKAKFFQSKVSRSRDLFRRSKFWTRIPPWNSSPWLIFNGRLKKKF